jgi:hypothetical protein
VLLQSFPIDIVQLVRLDTHTAIVPVFFALLKSMAYEELLTKVFFFFFSRLRTMFEEWHFLKVEIPSFRFHCLFESVFQKKKGCHLLFDCYEQWIGTNHQNLTMVAENCVPQLSQNFHCFHYGERSHYYEM